MAKKVKVGIAFNPEIFSALAKQARETNAYYSTIVNEALVHYWNGEGHSDSLKDQVNVIQAKMDEKLTGDLIGSYEKERKKLHTIKKLVSDRIITAEKGSELTQSVKRNYAKSRDALGREHRRRTRKGAPEGSGAPDEDDSKYTDLLLRIDMARDRMARKEHRGLLAEQVDYVQRYANEAGISFKRAREILLEGKLRR